MAEVSAKSFLPETFQGNTVDLASQLGLVWELIKAPLIVPLLKLAVFVCLTMELMLFCERLYMGIVIILVKLFWKKPDKRYNWEPMTDDLEMGNSNFPLVLIQIPMFNEREVYKISIGAACNLSWPSDRLVIQVLDDSTDPIIKDMVEKECQRWAAKGLNITYQIRESRGGYKAGALKEGLKRDYVKECEYVAIFDADFRPEPDFLRRSIPFLMHNPQIALVQARWRFVNSNECLMTRMQEMSLDYHFTVEQEVGSATHAFFGFNGTGGIWRIAAINEAGGWKDRTTVEDMDLAVRASLKGWKFVYLGDLQVKSELPLTIMVPEIDVPEWGAIYIPCIITTLNSVGTPRSIHLLFYWILFENVMSFHRTKATFIGLLEAKRANEWVVTEKLGDALKNKNNKPAKKFRFNIGDRIHITELGFAGFLFFCGCYDYLYGKNNYFVYMFLQTITFSIVGFGYIGTIVPSS
uniref:glucomannan 4-beta-mannosyltransferase n=1 Tax=Panax notoginseng TaxID=44586 RepID=F4YF63_9APIA|nr:glycosyltransferase [Panax notoginseng]